jgi:hypothetical protein
MPLFSSTQPSIRARILPRFPAQVLAGTGISITKSGGTYVFATTGLVTASSLHLPSLINAVNDAAAATAGVQLGQVYRNGNVLMVRLA